MPFADIDLLALAGNDDIVERKVDGRRLYVHGGEGFNADDADLHRTHDLIIHQHSAAEWLRLSGIACARCAAARATERSAEPIIRAASRQAAKLCRHRARDILAAIDNIVNRLPRDAGGLAHRNLIEPESFDFRPKVFAWAQVASGLAVSHRFALDFRGHTTHSSGGNLLRRKFIVR